MGVKLSCFSASFHDYELDLDYYHGKDVVHQGCLLKLDPGYSWERINSKIRNKIRGAQKLDVDIKRVQGTAEDIANFRTIWFDPNDPTLPDHLEPDEIMYMAYMDGTLVGGLILTPSSKTVLYMHNLGSNEDGKRKNIPGLILWHAVEDLKDSQYEYIDVGVSFRPTLYMFFRNWQTDSYPIIFSPPFIRPDIRLAPFTSADIATYQGDTPCESLQTAKQYFGEEFTILPRAVHCLKAVLKYLNIQKDDSVAVFKTFNNEDMPRCVSDTIEYFGTLTREITDTTKAVVVIHDFGFPYQQTKELKTECEKRGIPLIEDCAWTYGSMIDADTKVGNVGDYAIYSLPKILPMQYGGILKGLNISDEENWNTYQMLDYFKREIVLSQLHQHLPKLGEHNQQRRQNWQYLAQLFAQDGFECFTGLESNVYPGVFLVRLDSLTDMPKRYEEFGVESIDFGDGKILALPVHGQLGANQLDYIYGVFRGKLNLSSDYQRSKN